MSTQLKLVTFNVRCTWKWTDGFVNRMGLIYDKIKTEKPDVIGFQEITDQILEGLQHIMPDYLFVGHGRDGDYSGEGLYIAINTKTVKLIGLNTFWIAPNPYDKYSKFSDQSGCPRICISATLYHPETKTEFRVFNIHLDHIGALAKSEGMKCVLSMVNAENSKVYMPCAIMGDFNEYPDGPANKICKAWDAPKIYEATADIKATFHGYGRLAAEGREYVKIDYIYVTEDLKKLLSNVETWEDELNGHLLSDHFPVSATFEIE